MSWCNVSRLMLQKDIKKYSTRFAFQYICSYDILKNHLSLYLVWQHISNKSSTTGALQPILVLLDIKLLTMEVMVSFPLKKTLMALRFFHWDFWGGVHMGACQNRLWKGYNTFKELNYSLVLSFSQFSKIL